MNKDESLKLYREGKDAWNEWANSFRDSDDGSYMVADFSNQEFDERLNFIGFIFPGEARFTGSKFKQSITFNNANFKKLANFRHCIFCNNANFNDAEYEHDTDFSYVEFYGNTNFNRTKFKHISHFNNMKFHGEIIFFKEAEFNIVGFHNSKFLRNVSFENANFLEVGFEEVEFGNVVNFDYAEFREANFNQSLFKGYSTFYKVIFSEYTTFASIKGEGFFSLDSAEFKTVPNFEQAHFLEAPNLDTTIFPVVSTFRWRRKKFESSNRIPYYWRSLKRLALQGHNHKQEIFFFANEIISLRDEQKAYPIFTNLFTKHSIWQGFDLYWAGLAYQIFSDFGRSTLRPLFWLIIFAIISAVFYLSQHLTKNNPNSTFIHWFIGTEETSSQKELSCICNSSDDHPVYAAFNLSIRSGLTFLGLGRSDKLLQSYTCLYGEGQQGQPEIPYEVEFISIIQAIISGVLFFLLLLALRNFFRIK